MASSEDGGRVSGDVRRHNLALILRQIARSGPMARSEVAAATGITRGAVTALSFLLVEAGILREQVRLPQGRGRPLARLELAADGVCLMILQLDAEAATVVIADLAGTELFRRSTLHGRPIGDPSAVLDVTADVLAHGLQQAERFGRRVSDVSVVVFAPVGGHPVQVIGDSDLGWGRVDLLAELRARVPDLAATVRLDGDAPLAALAELALLPGVKDAIYVKSNSGIGGAVVIDGSIAGGRQGLGGAFGHLPLVPDGLLCECGQRGCLVTVAGPDVVLRAAGLESVLLAEGLTIALGAFVERVTSGEAVATAAWRSAAPWIARALQIWSVTLDPEVIVLGGYWATLTPSIEREFLANRPLAVGEGDITETAVVAGRLGADAAIHGAIWAARDRVLADALALGVHSTLE